MTTARSNQGRWLVPVAFFCVYFFWGSTFVAIRYSVQFLTPAFVSGFRYLFAGLIMMGVLMARGVRISIPRPELARAAVLAFLMLVINNIFLGWAEEYVTAGYAALLTASVPLFIAVAETLIPGGTPLSRLGWFGSTIGFAGLLLLLAPVLRHGLVLHGGDARDGGLTIGTIILVFGIAAWIVGTLIAGRKPSKLNPFLGSALQMTLAGAVNLIIGTAVGGWHTAHWTPKIFLALAWLTTFGSLVGFSAYTYLLHHVPVAKVATYAYVNPIVAVILSAIFLGESLQGSQWIAMVVILAAVAVVTASKAKPKPAAEPEAELAT